MYKINKLDSLPSFIGHLRNNLIIQKINLVLNWQFHIWISEQKKLTSHNILHDKFCNILHDKYCGILHDKWYNIEKNWKRMTNECWISGLNS